MNEMSDESEVFFSFILVFLLILTVVGLYLKRSKQETDAKAKTAGDARKEREDDVIRQSASRHDPSHSEHDKRC